MRGRGGGQAQQQEGFSFMCCGTSGTQRLVQYFVGLTVELLGLCRSRLISSFLSPSLFIGAATILTVIQKVIKTVISMVIYFSSNMLLTATLPQQSFQRRDNQRQNHYSLAPASRKVNKYTLRRKSQMDARGATGTVTVCLAGGEQGTQCINYPANDTPNATNKTRRNRLLSPERDKALKTFPAWRQLVPSPKASSKSNRDASVITSAPADIAWRTEKRK